MGNPGALARLLHVFLIYLSSSTFMPEMYSCLPALISAPTPENGPPKVHFRTVDRA